MEKTHHNHTFNAAGLLRDNCPRCNQLAKERQWLIPLVDEIYADFDEELGATDEKKEANEESILAEAERLINGDRQSDYGHPIYDFTTAMNILNALGFRRYVGPHTDKMRRLGPQDHPVVMVAVKLSREYSTHKRDNLTDGAGYLGCLEKVWKKILSGFKSPWKE